LQRAASEALPQTHECPAVARGLPGRPVRVAPAGIMQRIVEIRDQTRVRMVSGLLEQADFKSRVLDDIRSEIWLKLWGNLTFNPISALTHSTLVDICQFPLTRELAAAMMTEAQVIGERLGARFRVPMERRIAGAEGVGKHKTSMLQDVEAGKPLEIDGMLGVVVELAAITGVEVPTLRALYACASLLNKTIQDERVRIKVAPLAG
ncbi:MAG TPA: hypothetical protein EYM36_01815, partial [Acidobacteria bacterium]|nr:hypothetical protein [Acidobacteriota bacterium]